MDSRLREREAPGLGLGQIVNRNSATARATELLGDREARGFVDVIEDPLRPARGQDVRHALLAAVVDVDLQALEADHEVTYTICERGADPVPR